MPSPDGPQTLRTTEVLYPFFEHHADEDNSWHVLRPLYNAQSGPGDRFQVQYLWPLGLTFRGGARETHHRLFPLFGYHRTWSAKEERHSVHAHFLQLLRWGNDAEHGPYMALFPLAGITHDVLGPTWSFVLFPLYSHYRRGDYVRNDFPWPVLGYGGTPDGRARQYRFWPFYVYQQDEDEKGLYVRHDLLWPLFRWGRLDRGGDYYHTVFVAVPFYATVKSWNRSDELVAARTATLGFRRAWDTREVKDTTGWAALWSAVADYEGATSDYFRILPFYWRTTRYRTTARDPDRSWTRRRILWPLIWLDIDTLTQGVRKESFILAPFYWHFTDVYAGEDGPDQVARRVTLWPLATWEQSKAGGKSFWVASRGWTDPTRGFKRNYRAFFDLFQYHHDPGGMRETRLVSRLYHHRRGPKGRYLSLMSLFTYDSTGEVVGEPGSYLSLLFGLVKCSWTEKARRWRVLYVPLGPKLAE
ncbi:MAG: hypothetical protein PVJ27_04500 [Candidatus Brocadiaceae bacterium]